MSGKNQKPKGTDTNVAAYEIEIDGYKCRLKKMNRATMEVAIGLIMPGSGQAPKYIKAGEIILETCWLDGDKEILEDEELKIAAALAAYNLVDLKVAKLKKL